MHGSHLTCRNASWVFQRRVPAPFAKSFPSAPIRVTIGHVGKRVAQRAARHRWLVAEDAIHELGMISGVGGMPMTGATRVENGQAVRSRLDDWAKAVRPALVALHFDPADLPDGHGKGVVAASLDGLVDMCQRALSRIDPIPAPHCPGPPLWKAGQGRIARPRASGPATGRPAGCRPGHAPVSRGGHGHAAAGRGPCDADAGVQGVVGTQGRATVQCCGRHLPRRDGDHARRAP